MITLPFRTNGVKLDAKGGHAMGLGLFPTYSLLNHSCVCNTRTIKRVDANMIHSLEVVATKDIKKGLSDIQSGEKV